MKKYAWFLVGVLLVAVIAIFIYKYSPPSPSTEKKPVNPMVVSENLPKTRLFFSAEAAEVPSYSKEELEAMGWSFEKRSLKGSTVRLAKLQKDNQQGERIELVFLYGSNGNPRLLVRVFRHVKSEGRDVLSQVFVTNTLQLVTRAKRMTSAENSEKNPPLLAFSIDEKGFVQGDIELLNSVLEKDPRIQVVGFPVDDKATSEQRQKYRQAVKKAKDAGEPVTDEIKALKPPPKKLAHHEFELEGWGSAMKVLQSL